MTRQIQKERRKIRRKNIKKVLIDSFLLIFLSVAEVDQDPGKN